MPRRLAGARMANGRIDRETAHHDRLERRRHEDRSDLRRRSRRGAYLLRADLAGGALEDSLAGEQEISERADRVEIGCGPDAAAGQRLGRDVARRARRSAPTSPIGRAIPKSTTFATSGMPPRSHKMMLPGLMSRWTSPLPCASASAPQICDEDRGDRDRSAAGRRAARARAGRRRVRGTPSRSTGRLRRYGRSRTLRPCSGDAAGSCAGPRARTARASSGELRSRQQELHRGWPPQQGVMRDVHAAHSTARRSGDRGCTGRGARSPRPDGAGRR